MSGAMYWMDRVIENFDKIWPILMKMDSSAVEEQADRMATKKHIELLKGNKNPLKRVMPISTLKRGYMKGVNMVFAMGVAKILDIIKEGENRIYGGLEFSLVDGKLKTIPLLLGGESK